MRTEVTALLTGNRKSVADRRTTSIFSNGLTNMASMLSRRCRGRVALDGYFRFAPGIANIAIDRRTSFSSLTARSQPVATIMAAGAGTGKRCATCWNPVGARSAARTTQNCLATQSGKRRSLSINSTFLRSRQRFFQVGCGPLSRRRRQLLKPP